MTSVDVDPSLSKRLDVYREIEAYRKRPLIVYATSTRSGVRAMLDGDAVSQIVEQIRAIGKGPAIDVLVHSYGGDPLAAWRIMSTLRESYEKVGVLVPFSAFSAATLLALGADEIVMHPFAALGPIDPQIQARTPKGDIQFAYEDVGAFLKFVKEHVGLTEQAFLTPIMDKLFTMAEPLTIGALVPRLISADGPMRIGMSYGLIDETAPRYATANRLYRFTLCIAGSAPSVSSTWIVPPWNSGGVYSNSVKSNLPTTFTVLAQSIGSTFAFTIPYYALGGVGTPYYGQLFVEELDTSASNSLTGHWAASRGTWIGVAP